MKHSLEMKNIVKRFPGVLANNNVNLTIQAGEIHALLGENGAGKSTLMQILYGFHSMDSGEIVIDGQRVHLGSPKDAIALGIGMVHQEFMLVRPFSVVENTVLGLRESSAILDLRRASEKLLELSERHGLALDPAAEVGSLPIGVQQRVEILKLLYRDARLLILDEPTAVLTPQEKDHLFAVLRKLREDGRSVVIVTHKLAEIMELADRVTVMRDGQAVATRTIGSTSGQELTRLMVGREVNLRADKSKQKPGGPILQIEDLHVRDESGQEKVRGLSLRSTCRRNPGHCRRRWQRPIRTCRSGHAPAQDRKRPRASEWRRCHRAERRAASRRRAFPMFRPTAGMLARSLKCPSRTMQFLACNENMRAACFADIREARESAQDSCLDSEFAPPESISRPENFPAAIFRS